MGWKLLTPKKTQSKKDEIEWPDVLDSVWVKLDCCNDAVHPSRVEDIVEGRLVIAAPSKPHLKFVDSPGSSEKFTIGWRDGSLTTQANVRFVGEGDSLAPTWMLEAVGQPKKIQRRSYVRADWSHDVLLHLPDGTVHGRMCDISEGGIRCDVPNMAVPRKHSFEVSFQLDGETIVLEAGVAWWGSGSGRTVQVGLEFSIENGRDRDKIRKHIFALLQEERKRSLV